MENETKDGNKDETSRWELYEILGAKVVDDIEEIRKKRKRLALIYHPDKNQDSHEAQEKMQAVNRAFEVLSNPLKRQIYDNFGPDALSTYENGTVGDTPWKLALYFTKPKSILNLTIFSFFGFCFLLFVPSLISYKMDGGIDTNWFYIFTPLFMIDLLIFGVIVGKSYLLLLLESKHEESSDTNHETFLHETPLKKNWRKFIFDSIRSSITLILFSFFELLLSLKLDDIIGYSWWIVFLPVIVIQLYSTYCELQNLSVKEYTVTVQLDCNLGYNGYLLRNLYSSLLLFINTVLFIYNIDNATISSNIIEYPLNWWFVFTPTLLWVFIGLCISIIENCCYSKLQIRKPKIEGEAHIFEEPPSIAVQLLSIGCSCIFYSFIFIFTILFVNWISSFELSGFVLFLPVFMIILVSCCICLCCAIPFFYCMVMGNKYAENNTNKNV